jgi:hypothetical protein
VDDPAARHYEQQHLRRAINLVEDDVAERSAQLLPTKTPPSSPTA